MKMKSLQTEILWMSCKKSTTLFEFRVEIFKRFFPFNVSRVESIDMCKTFNISLAQLSQIHFLKNNYLIS